MSTYIKFYIKFILEEFMYVPAFAKPSCAFLVGLQSKPVIICLFVVLYILQQTKLKSNVHVIWPASCEKRPLDIPNCVDPDLTAPIYHVGSNYMQSNCVHSKKYN